MDQQRLDAVEPEAGEAHLIALEYAVARVVETRLERQTAGPTRVTVGVRIGWAHMHASDFGREHETVARLGAQHVPKAQLALAVAIPGRGIEIADPGGVSGVDGRAGLSFRNGFAHVAQGGPAEAQLGEPQRGRADGAAQKGIHGVLALLFSRLQSVPKLSVPGAVSRIPL